MNQQLTFYAKRDSIRPNSQCLNFHGYETLTMACLTGCVIQFEQISEPAQGIEVCPKFLRKEIAISAPDPALKFFAISDNEFKRLSKRTVNQPLRAYSRPDPTDLDAMAVWNSTKRPIVARRTAEHRATSNRESAAALPQRAGRRRVSISPNRSAR